jgi:hypothetical protein
LANAAPNCTEAIPINTIQTGSIRAKAARTQGLCHIGQTGRAAAL